MLSLEPRQSERRNSVVLARPHDHHALGRLDMAHENVFVLAPVAVLAADAGLDRAGHLGDDQVGFPGRQPGRAMAVELRHRIDSIGMRNAATSADGGDVHRARGRVGGRPADRLVALVVPHHDQQVGGLLVAHGGQDAQVEHHPAVRVQGDDAPVRQPGGQAEGLRGDAAELLLEQAGRAHVRGGVVPLVDAGPQGEDDELIAQARAQGLHAFVALHRTFFPPSTMAE